MAKPERRDRGKEKYWRRLLGQWRRSGLSGREFCAEQGLSEASFYAWRREIARRDQEAAATTAAATTAAATTAAARPQQSQAAQLPAFVKVMVAADADASSAVSVIEVVVREGRLLRVRPGFDADLFRQLVRLLEDPAC
jgi:hypothetical protein